MVVTPSLRLLLIAAAAAAALTACGGGDSTDADAHGDAASPPPVAPAEPTLPPYTPPPPQPADADDGSAGDGGGNTGGGAGGNTGGSGNTGSGSSAGGSTGGSGNTGSGSSTGGNTSCCNTGTGGGYGGNTGGDIGGTAGGTGTTPSTPLAAVNPTITTFAAGEGGTAGVTATGGKAPYAYELLESETAAITVNGDGTVTVPPSVTPGTYRVRVRVRDDNGTTAISDFSVTVKPRAEDSQQLTIHGPEQKYTTVNGMRGGTVRLWVEGGQPDYTWRINASNFLPGANTVTFGDDYIAGAEPTGLVMVNAAAWGTDEKLETGKDADGNPIYGYFRRVSNPGACVHTNNVGRAADDVLSNPAPFNLRVEVTDSDGRWVQSDEFTITVKDCK